MTRPVLLPHYEIVSTLLSAHSPLDGLGIGASGCRLLYCVIMGSWGADLLTNLLNTSLYYSSPFSITDSVYFFS